MTLGSQVFTNAARYGTPGMHFIAFSYHSITGGHHLGLRRVYAAECKPGGAATLLTVMEFGQEL